MNTQKEIKILNYIKYVRELHRNDMTNYNNLATNSNEYFVSNHKNCSEDLFDIFILNYYNHYYLEVLYLLRTNVKIKDYRKTLNNLFAEKLSGTSHYSLICDDELLRDYVKTSLAQITEATDTAIMTFIKSRAIFYTIFNRNLQVVTDVKYELIKHQSDARNYVKFSQYVEELSALCSQHYNGMMSLEMFLLGRKCRKSVPTDLIKSLVAEMNSSSKMSPTEDLSIDKLTELRNSLKSELNELMQEVQ